MVARVSMIIPFNEGFRRIRNNNNNNNNNNKFSLNRSSTNVQPLSRVINQRDSVTQSSNPQQLLQQQAREIRREILRARFTMHNLYGVATAGCSSCGS